jgi:hypothetical protein
MQYWIDTESEVQKYDASWLAGGFLTSGLART